jgi:hypothetical protein
LTNPIDDGNVVVMTTSDNRRRDGRPNGVVASWISDELPPEVRQEFWDRVVAFETAPLMTDFHQLTDAGVDLPAPEALDDRQTTAKLWEVIHALADLNVFLECTDHLSDRELYALLWRDLLRTENPFVDDGGAWHVDVLGRCSGEDVYLYLKHYADALSREHWLADYPDYDMPPHEDPPYDRDRHLPTPYAC